MASNVSGVRGHGFESHSKPFLLTYIELMKAYEALSSVFNYKISLIYAIL